MRENNLQGKRRKKKHKRSENGILAGSILLCIVTLASITICLVMVFQNRAAQLQNVEVMSELETARQEMETSYTQDEVDQMIQEAVTQTKEQTSQEVSGELLGKLKEMMQSGDGATEMLRYFFPEEIVVADAGQYYFFPIQEGLKKHTYDPQGFQMDGDQVMHYYENGERVSHKGIDVSKYQEEINWKKVADDEVEYAFIRLGIRGYTEGEILVDDNFQANIKGALENGIDVGVYFFTQATSEAEAEEEAAFVIDSIEQYDVSYPVVIDIEAVSNNNARTKDLTKEERTKYCITFCEKIKEAGYTPMIYGNLKSFMLMLDMEQLEEYDKWFAYYDDRMYFPYAHKIWQYTSTGRVSGIAGDVDLNISFEELKDE